MSASTCVNNHAHFLFFPSAVLTVFVTHVLQMLEQPRVPLLTPVTDWQTGQTQGEWCIVCLTAPQPSGMPGKSWESLTFKAGRLSESDGKRGVRQTQGPVSILLLCGIPIPPKTPSNGSDGQEREGRAQPSNGGVLLLSSAMAQVAQVALRIWAGMCTSVCIRGTRGLIDRSHQRQPNDTPNHQLRLIKVPNWMSLINNVCPQ